MGTGSEGEKSNQDIYNAVNVSYSIYYKVDFTQYAADRRKTYVFKNNSVSLLWNTLLEDLALNSAAAQEVPLPHITTRSYIEKQQVNES